MTKVLKKQNMGTSDLGWLQSRFHFSFAEYRNPQNINFGVLRVLNDDIVKSNSGFNTHPHQNMEIITYIVDGELTHKDSMGNEETLTRGEVQYLSAGDGISHSEHNLNRQKDLRLLQIWILPPQNGLPRLYGSHKFTQEDRKDKLLNIVSSKDANTNAKIKIYQDINIFVCETKKNQTFQIKNNTQIYFVLIEGKVTLNDQTLEFGDACEITNEELIKIDCLEESHYLFIEMEER
jgi:redox-sensitive bicupin YhaK (pirin superfamily)